MYQLIFELIGKSCSNTSTIWYWKITSSVLTKYSFLMFEKPTFMIEKELVRDLFLNCTNGIHCQKKCRDECVIYGNTFWRVIQKGLWLSIVWYQIKLLVRTCLFCGNNMWRDFLSGVFLPMFSICLQVCNSKCKRSYYRYRNFACVCKLLLVWPLAKCFVSGSAAHQLNGYVKECVRSCDQKPYLHNETKGGICIQIEFNPQKNISLLQDGCRFFVYSSNMAPVMSYEHTL